MKTVGIVANVTKEGFVEAMRSVRGWAAEHSLRVMADESLEAHAPDGIECVPSTELATAAELVFAFGGDGTLLYAVGMLASAGLETPVIGVNLGSLGFLTQIAGEELGEVLDRLDPSSLPLSRRMMLSAGVRGRDGVAMALNDVVMAKGADSRMMSFEARVDGELVTRYAADGLILATPTGSTAYSVSAGGPVVMPELEAIIATPICPHTLSMRSCVIPPDAEVEVEMLWCDDRTLVSTDGNRAFEICTDDVVVVRRAATNAMLVDVTSHPYYEILRKKMRWAGRVRER